MKKKGRVFVGLSGGVDSSVSAALLQKDGYEVTGVFIKTWHPDFLPCTWKEDRLDAMRVAAHLGIPFVTLDLEKEYKEEVADYMIEEYKRGRTPNPDVMCNKNVKFGGFMEYALVNGADFVATGHYTRIENRKSRIENSRDEYVLLAGTDKNKDQSYFLWTLTQGQLKHILFPVGDIEKPEVRRLAKKFGLPTAEKKDSQGVCFLGKLDMAEFLEHYESKKRGDVLNDAGEIIGWHDGAIFYTLGARHGFTITKKGTSDAPYFVVAKDIRANTLTVSHKEKGSLKGKGERALLLENINWISGTLPDPEKTYSARVRYRGELLPCKVSRVTHGEQVVVEFSEDQEPVAPGQSVVMYDGEECLGGGILQG
ncbi:MAG: tRNA 2-thiouridine(34) synthase MnmA [Candidatus Paceibacterota bacterium]|jgi:tRNA-specific 2-thiouridylase|nr:tRNA 2-thiouridine(34) synthase MnmA [Candidatus Paceibacterota bacterium]